MCGRFAFYSPTEATAALFGVRTSTDMSPRYNISPSQEVVAIRQSTAGELELASLRWGLVPFWAKAHRVGARMINAVGETISAKPAFRAAFKKRRCLVLANGFYEWRKEGKRKIATYIYPRSGEPMAFAGLWETWKSPEGQVVQSCTIVTTPANPLIQPLHNRMPVILPEETQALWLDPLTEDPKILEPLLVPAPVEMLTSHPVADTVNSVKNQGPECILPLPERPDEPPESSPEDSPGDGRLFK